VFMIACVFGVFTNACVFEVFMIACVFGVFMIACVFTFVCMSTPPPFDFQAVTFFLEVKTTAIS
jgi:hypothetical protein